MSANPPDPDATLARLQPLLNLLYQALDTSIQDAKAYFDARNETVDPWLFPDQVRYGVKRLLAKHGHTAEEEEQLEQVHLPNNGLMLHVGNDRIRILKADGGDIPAPGPSLRRLEYFNANSQVQLNIGNGDGGSQIHRFLLVWGADDGHHFTDLYLAYPLSGTRTSVVLAWSRSVPHPATTITPQTPSTPEPTEDLPIEPDVDEEKKKGTGTDGQA